MLDDDERTVLEETARDLARDDPQLVRRMQRGWGRGDGRGRRVAVTVVMVVLVVGLLWLELPGQALLVVMVGIGFLLAFGWQPSRWVPAVLRPDEDEPGT
ncbi:DUF3040 domain-containing protein [Actinomycetospora endophytica]|uniref:DUF3040 domain-containing protein n=1 Tax=Actinomycetospora endophytica TaxID=2291215 RepID=A0ABS8PD81_9PSEU|nr:DUF3040 domain-containing protein [Actinomycetospora endophytica]MCD2195425.1 DUF3040 domain-containing protein [Actinomycetospora endophytica]